MNEEKEPFDFRICARCTGDSFLKSEIERIGEVTDCNYCIFRSPTLFLEKIAEYVGSAFERLYYLHQDEDGDGEPIVELLQERAGVSEKAAGDLRWVLEKMNYSQDDAINGIAQFGEDTLYKLQEEDGGDTFHNWSEFQYSLREEARLFNASAAAFLDNVFEGLTGHSTKKGEDVIRPAGPGTDFTHFYRARSFEKSEDVKATLTQPDRELGPPPPEVSGSGRMNVQGISVFYGATTPKTALAEIRPAVGADVLVAKFELLRPLRLLDIESLRRIYVKCSAIDPKYDDHVRRMHFLGYVSQLMSAPVLPGRQNMDYIITQGVAEYLANSPGLEIDGLLYPSVQTGDHSLNVVLFHKASRMELLPPGLSIDPSYGDDFDDERPMYSVVEGKKSDALSRRGIDTRVSYRDYRDKRDHTLRIDRFSIQYHKIKGVEIDSGHYEIKWRQQ